jgi:hypothetical protein
MIEFLHWQAESDLQWAPPAHSLPQTAVTILHQFVPNFTVDCEAQIYRPSFEVEDLFSACEGFAIILRPVGGHGKASLHEWNSKLGQSLEADKTSVQALPYSGGLPHLFGVPRVEGDATSTIHLTTLVARLDFTNIPEAARLQLPTHRSTLLSVLHRALQDTLLYKYD